MYTFRPMLCSKYYYFGISNKHIDALSFVNNYKLFLFLDISLYIVHIDLYEQLYIWTVKLVVAVSRYLFDDI